MLVPVETVQPTMRVEDVARAFNISRNSAYEAVKAGEIPVVRAGRRMLVPTAWVRRTLQLDGPTSPRPAA